MFRMKMWKCVKRYRKYNIQKIVTEEFRKIKIVMWNLEKKETDFI